MALFEKLTIWKDSIDLAGDIFELTKTFNKDLQWSLGDQIRRASLSISSNIAEGSGSESGKEEQRFLDIALKSSYETLSQLYFYERVTGKKVSDFINRTTILIKQIKAYRKARKNYF